MPLKLTDTLTIGDEFKLGGTRYAVDSLDYNDEGETIIDAVPAEGDLIFTVQIRMPDGISMKTLD